MNNSYKILRENIRFLTVICTINKITLFTSVKQQERKLKNKGDIVYLKFQFQTNYADHIHIRSTGIETVETVTYILKSWMKVPWTDASASPSTCASAYCSILQATDSGMIDVALAGSNQDHK